MVKHVKKDPKKVTNSLAELAKLMGATSEPVVEKNPTLENLAEVAGKVLEEKAEKPVEEPAKPSASITALVPLTKAEPPAEIDGDDDSNETPIIVIEATPEEMAASYARMEESVSDAMKQILAMAAKDASKIPTLKDVLDEMNALMGVDHIAICTRATMQALISENRQLQGFMRQLLVDAKLRINGKLVTSHDVSKWNLEKLLRNALMGVKDVARREEMLGSLKSNYEQVVKRQTQIATESEAKSRELRVARDTISNLQDDLNKREEIQLHRPKAAVFMLQHERSVEVFLKGERNEAGRVQLKTLRGTKKFMRALTFETYQEALDLLERMIENTKRLPEKLAEHPERWRPVEVAMVIIPDKH